VSDTVRHEVARVEREGDVDLADAVADDDKNTRFARALPDDPRYRSRSWSDIEPDAERDWTSRYPDSPWPQARDRVRRNWEDATD